MSSVESLTLKYDLLNALGTFSEGDTIRGIVTLHLLKETKIQRLFVKVKGDANVYFTEKTSDEDERSYDAHLRYFKLKQFLVPQASESDETILPMGIHVYKFQFQLPEGSMPSSNKSTYGRIVYKIEVKLCRNWRMDSFSEKEIPFVSKRFPNSHLMMSQQTGSVQKKMGLFSKGQVTLDVAIDKHGVQAGENIAITARINNMSSKKVTPKIRLIKVETHYAKGETKELKEPVVKLYFDPIEQNTNKIVAYDLKIPPGLTPSIENCKIIKIHYKLKIYLDISFASDPEVFFPVTILPPNLRSDHLSEGAAGPHAPAAFGPGKSDLLPPGNQMGTPSTIPQAGCDGFFTVKGHSEPSPAFPKPL